MFGLGTPELIVILSIAFLVFGGKKLPELGAGLGKAITSFKKGLKDVEQTGKDAVSENVPGLKEVAALRDGVNQVKDLGKVLGK
ncbi:MAG: twin-arginine translocase TatA/TatE family subunit [Desulfobulbaceae bacterium]|nr:twin-arginine translocase TatA/TatE family subunit [Desulfobulbaceae bacterium]HIJ79057.1 twin-arginine translocase TatA/TatE family subunit [Deltaproteobacteria bacterium]